MIDRVEAHRAPHPQRLEGKLEPRQRDDAQLGLRDRIASAEGVAVVVGGPSEDVRESLYAPHHRGEVVEVAVWGRVE